jgi:TM2 domain-containing membrane protein YozV
MTLAHPRATNVIRFPCPHCGKKVKVPDGSAGKRGNCPRCGGRVQVPGPDVPSLTAVYRPSPEAVRVTEDDLPEVIIIDGDHAGQAVQEAGQPTEPHGVGAKSPGEKYCLECRAVIRARAVVCPQCGVSQAGREERETKYCHECGARIRGRAVVCPKCGVQQSGVHGAAGDGLSAVAGPGDAVKDFAGKKIAAGLCGILLGGLGIHKFILGLSTAGIIMLAVTVGGLVTCGISTLAMCVIGLVEGIIYLTKSDEEFYRLYAVEKKQWF